MFTTKRQLKAEIKRLRSQNQSLMRWIEEIDERKDYWMEIALSRMEITLSQGVKIKNGKEKPES